MCVTRLHQHGCGHVRRSYISRCRGTYADPKGTNIICTASPAFTFIVAAACTSCLYRKFRDDWEKKLTDAQGKQSVARQMMYEIQEEGANGGELDDGWPCGGGMGGFSGDSDSIYHECRRVEADLERLREEYERQSLTQWKSIVDARSSSSRRPQRPISRATGRSPLRHAEASVDLPDPVDDGDETDDSQSSSSMSRSPSLISDSGSNSEDAIEDSWMPYTPPPNLVSQSMYALSDLSDGKPTFGLAEATSELGGLSLQDDDQMLPDYSF